VTKTSMTRAVRLSHPLLPEDVQERFRREGHWEGRTLPEIVAHHVEQDPDALAIAGPASMSYGELWNRSRRLAGGLAEAGLRPGDCLVAVLDNTWQGVVLELAAATAGLVYAPRSMHLSATLLQNLVEQLDAKGLVLQAELLDKPDWADIWNAGAESMAGRRFVVNSEADVVGSSTQVEALMDEGPLAPPVEVDPLAPCLVLATGGTTGVPKSILHCAETLLYAVRHFGTAFGLSADDTFVAFAPYGHAGGSVFDIYMPLYHGASILPIARWQARDVADRIGRWGGNFFIGMGTHLYDLLALDPPPTQQLSSVRRIVAGAGPDTLFIDTQERFGVEVCRVYGCSECPGHAVGRAEDPDEIRLHQDGVLFPGIEHRLLDVSGAPVAPGVAGEYQCRGPNLFMGYAGHPELTSEAVTEDGFYRSGDLLVQSTDGYLSWAGRTKDIIRRGGLQIDPLEIENLLMRRDDIAAAVVVGQSDDRLGERAVVVSVSKGPVRPSLEELCDHLQDCGIPKANLPERLVWAKTLERTAVGKFHRVEIRRQLEDLAVDATTLDSK